MILLTYGVVGFLQKKKDKKEKKEKRHKDKSKEKDHHERGEAGAGDGVSKEKKKKKKKDRERERDGYYGNSHRSPRSSSRSPLGASGSSPMSAAQPREPVVQVTGTKLKIKLVPPKPTSTGAPAALAGGGAPALAGQRAASESDSNHGSSSGASSAAAASTTTPMRIKIPIDKLDATGAPVHGNRPDLSGGSGKDKRKRRTEDFEDGQSTASKSRKLQHY